MSNHRKARGAATQRIVAEFLRRIWPHVESVGGGAPGRDLTGTPGVAVEVKARRGFDPLAWLRQARTHIRTPGELPLVIFRPDGMGETTVNEWPCLLRLEDLTRLLQEAGYGNPPTP